MQILLCVNKFVALFVMRMREERFLGACMRLLQVQRGRPYPREASWS